MEHRGARREEISPATLAAALAGDQAAFAALVRHYDPLLRSLAYHLLGDAFETDDALQDAYVKVFRGLPGFSGSSALSTWLTRVTYTTCIEHLRRRGRLVPTSELDPEQQLASAPDPADDLASREIVRQTLRRLPPEQRAVVVLVGVQGLDYRQAAQILDIPSGTVASRLSSARRTLRNALRDGGASHVAADGLQEVSS